MSLSPPGVHLFYDPHWQDARAIDELCWGIEEQGVPCQVICCDEGRDASALSMLAARNSTLRVGLGLSAAGDIALTHAQLPDDRPLVTGHIGDNPGQIRILGANAGQLVKILPLSERK
ncbi:glycerol dehydratase reactivase beta/small subunit family protein [Phytobacter diazotrophicus]|jgi:hypothetical protein|uniref:glycerol dehydratase reactivase beta/small subunit family protein n=1 Tax=Phytobacter diazotrophicus TaxID=395631 RepID=UPI0029091A4D|nr:glycerol dehydratase reactivase beta/small subunit family protein [Enterobacteriaceae bacterium]